MTDYALYNAWDIDYKFIGAEDRKILEMMQPKDGRISNMVMTHTGQSNKLEKLIVMLSKYQQNNKKILDIDLVNLQPADDSSDFKIWCKAHKAIKEVKVQIDQVFEMYSPPEEDKAPADVQLVLDRLGSIEESIDGLNRRISKIELNN